MSNATATPTDWLDANQRYLRTALAAVSAALEANSATAEPREGTQPNIEADPEAIRSAMASPPTLDRLCATFALSPFERDLLLLCAGMELDAAFAARVAAARGVTGPAQPTFSLALDVLPGAHWSALLPTAPLRRWQLIQVWPGETLLTSPLRIDERILHLLVGLSYLDERLEPLVRPVPDPGRLPDSYRNLVEQALALWGDTPVTAQPPLLNLYGTEAESMRLIAAAIGRALGADLYTLPAGHLSGTAAEREQLARLWDREALLTGSLLYLDGTGLDRTEEVQHLAAFAGEREGLLVAATREPLPVAGRPAFRLPVRKPTAREQQLLWQEAAAHLAQPLPAGWAAEVTQQFDLSLPAIRQVAATAAGLTAGGLMAGGLTAGGLAEADPAEVGPAAARQRLWDACREQSRPRMGSLAQRIEPAARWDDLVLPEPQMRTLRAMAAQVRQRARVYQEWGFARHGSRGLGISALFSGGSGTGKSMAAEVLAHELRLDLYRIDLSAVVSKYIGETEKNLRQVFDAAEDGGAVLLFDEADALFGKRSEVKDSHDRYANIEIGYLLQRMEAYRGLAILTTNLKSALDTAFLRRIRFLVPFPFPDAAGRAEIWRRIFPETTPTEGLDPVKLAQLNLPGGHIRNIALTAAFLAADAGEPVRMTHLLRAAEMEYAKLERPLTAVETGGWLQ